MSVASPEHRLPPELEEVAPPGTYDPHYTIDISNRMQVPDKISVDGEDRDSDSEFFGQHALKADMNVPDRILVAGHEQHIGLKQEPRPLHLDYEPQENMQFVGLTTPPRVLTLDEKPFPTVDEDIQQRVSKSQNTSVNMGFETTAYQRTPVDDSHNQVDLYSLGPDSSQLTDADEQAVIQKQIAKLSRRLMEVEKDIEKRNYRDKILYYTLGLYVGLELLRWLFIKR